jgi:formimidoylglutamate deiminase
MTTRARLLWTPRAWLSTPNGEGWSRDVLLEIDAQGDWSRITVNVSKDQAMEQGAERLLLPLIPGLVNAHSHAFQRAFAGFAERREGAHDDFWSWRDRMYRVALAVSPQQLKAIATQLYVELLRGGYTHVCEFHYLHHDVNGGAYADPYAMSNVLIEAARDAGIGLTLLPVLYERAGFSDTTLRDDQRRFATSAEWVLSAQRFATDLAASSTTPLKSGVAIHSLRAASESSIHALLKRAHGPIHIHVAEQRAEVDECMKVNGMRPVEWLMKQFAVDQRWQLVHATHSSIDEINELARRGACVVLCPTTEANLGDGITDVAAWLNAGTTLSVGSDSHVTRDWREELRLLEYGQRLQHRARNIAASPSQGHSATAERLFSRMIAGGASAAGYAHWGIRVGARADALAVDTNESALLGVAESYTLDAMIFSSPSQPFRDVMVAGRWVIRNGQHAVSDASTVAFTQAMRELWTE